MEYRYKKPQFVKRGVDRIKRLSYEVLGEHQSKFGEDFADNKKVLDQVSIIRSKGLKNEVAGYITKYIKKQIREEKAKQAQRAESIQKESVMEEESEVDETIDVTESQEITADSDDATIEPKAIESEEISE